MLCKIILMDSRHNLIVEGSRGGTGDSCASDCASADLSATMKLSSRMRTTSAIIKLRNVLNRRMAPRMALYLAGGEGWRRGGGGSED